MKDQLLIYLVSLEGTILLFSGPSISSYYFFGNREILGEVPVNEVKPQLVIFFMYLSSISCFPRLDILFFINRQIVIALEGTDGWLIMYWWKR